MCRVWLEPNLTEGMPANGEPNTNTTAAQQERSVICPSYTELAESLPRLTKAQKKFIQQGTIYDWVEESQDIANELYESVEVGEKLFYRYRYVWWGTVEKQLQKGGLRLAKILNEIYR